MCPRIHRIIFKIAKTWKQPRCPSTDEQIKMWYIYIYTMDLEDIMLSEISQTNTICFHLYVKS